MQYLLTEDEHKELMREVKTWRALRFSMEDLQKFCTIVADRMPVKVPWSDAERPWGCIITKNDGYCDQCPAKMICPHPDKEWSK